MKTLYALLALIAFFAFSSFTINTACSYAGSNMSFVKSQTKKAQQETDINKARFYAYKAIKAIQSTAGKFDDCGCKEAEESVSESIINLKAAVKSTSLKGSQILYDEALEHIIDAVDALEQHKMHDSAFSSKEFAMNSKVSGKNSLPKKTISPTFIQKRLEISLSKYRASLQIVVDSVDCKQAKAYADKVFTKCEQELLKPNLSDAKKYYHLRTKEITKKALIQLDNCSNTGIK